MGMKYRLKSAYCGLRIIPLLFKRGLKIGRHVYLRGKPSIEIVSGAYIRIGNNVMINSSNKRYHVNMYCPVKLLADRPGAVIEIGDGTRIHGSCLHAYNSIRIGKNCLIAANCQIMDCNGHELSFDNVDARIGTTSNGLPIVIEDSVWVGANVIVLPGVRIGRGSVVAAGSVVVRDIPSMVIAGGNPAKVIKYASSNIPSLMP